ncbi:MAG: putative porin [Gammaproteobacteria bacterium]
MAQEVNTGDTANAKNSDNEAAAGVSDDTTQTASEGDQAESTVSADDVQGDVSSDAQVSSDEPPPDELMQQGETVEREANRIIEQVKKRREEEVEREAAKAKEVQPGDIRINHVPDVIKQEIKDELRGELRTGVLEDLISHAKTQRWGLPDANPEWFSRIKLKGDIRVRGQGDMMADDNINAFVEGDGYLDYLAVNDNGGIAYTPQEDRYFNSWEDRNRMRIRARLGLDAQVTQGLKASFRITTGNTNDPVSTNQTLGQYGNRYDVVWDRAYLEYKGPLTADRQWLKLSGGRMPNPFFATDLIWDSDLAFEGLAANFDINLRGSDNLMDITEDDRSLFITIGAFPLQEVKFSSQDKWLYGAQIGTHYIFNNQSNFKVALSYYHFANTTGKRNEQFSFANDHTAPDYLQKGNMLFNIRNDPGDPQAELWALASDFKEVALTLEYDIAQFAPIHVILTAEYVKNIGYDSDEIQGRTAGLVDRSGPVEDGIDISDEQITGYHAKVTVGWPKVTLRGNWRASVSYKRLEADAVMDAFTDSDFHLGGTDAEGIKLTYDYGVVENAWLSVNYISAKEIQSAPFNVETLQVDLNAKF